MTQSAHPAYLLARLNAKNVRFDVGSGGQAELTPQDIAASIAFVPPGLGRELMCRIWWPDGARLTGRELDAELVGIQFGEFRDRMDRMVTAQLRYATARNDIDRRRAQNAIESAREAMWPSIDGTYDLIRKAVVNELIDPRICPDCSGRGHVSKNSLVSICSRCSGGGRVRRGPTWRAAQLHMKHSSYLQTWQLPYEWMFATCSDAIHSAVRKMREAVS